MIAIRAHRCMVSLAAAVLLMSLPGPARPAEFPDAAAKIDLFFGSGAPPGLAGVVGGGFPEMMAAQRASAGHVYDSRELVSPYAPAFLNEDFKEEMNLAASFKIQEAYDKLVPRLMKAAVDPAVAEVGRRIDTVRVFFPEVDPAQGQWARALSLGVLDYLYGRDEHAMLRVSYAFSLNPVAPKLSAFLYRLERVTRIPSRRVATGTGLSLLEVTLNESKAAFQEKRYSDMVRFCRDALVIRPDHPAALSRLGTAFYLRSEYDKAVAVWGLALSIETRPREREAIEYMIVEAKSGGRAAASENAAAAKAAERRAEGRRAQAAGAYADAVKAYAQGDWRAAADNFKNMLELDPGNPKALKGLRRLEAEKRLP